ncbi:tRNA pseudouridine synthase A [Rhizoctonia solani]|uniref:tRNA pseudouridine synthase A n=2 Tax=Rhizoctonia solani TaxID=456999 RepID=A0A8H8STA5_9AGAM|nr:tRNA pseudouridine synthase A [Rhizoctonia solani]QRW17364.1 tRNA pseudouridine synthase A [Rhizoctonia solani]
MKRDSPCEPATEGVAQEKRPKFDESDLAKPDAIIKSAGSTSSVQAASTIVISEAPDGAPAGPGACNSNDPEDSTTSSSKRKNKTRGGRGRGRDQRARTERNAERKGSWASRGTRNNEDKPVDGGQERAPRLPKKKVAVLIGFCGTGYNGMQIQRDAGTNTIENTLFNAMVKAGAVSEDNSDDPVKVNLQRAARTDAGVHAAGNVVSLKMITEPPDTPDLVAKLNELLPPEIRVWTFGLRQPSIRVYVSLVRFVTPMPGTPMNRHTKPEMLDPNGPDWNYWAHPEASKAETRRAWRIGRGQFETLRGSAKLYEGKLKNHTFLMGSNGYQSCTTVKVLCYIRLCRKMTTLLIFASRTGSPAVTLIPQTFNGTKLVIPKAPALGLLLQEPRFGTYNKHVLEENELAAGRGQTDRIRELIEWEPLRENIDAFKHAFIYNRIRAEEAKHSVFAAWLKFIDDYEGWEFKYLNPRGEVPPEAVVHPGKRKRGTTDKFREYLWKNPASKGDESVTDSEDEDTSKKPNADMEG